MKINQCYFSLNSLRALRCLGAISRKKDRIKSNIEENYANNNGGSIKPEDNLYKKQFKIQFSIEIYQYTDYSTPLITFSLNCILIALGFLYFHIHFCSSALE